MRVLLHWVLVAAAIAAWVIAIAYSRTDGTPLVAAGVTFFALSIGLAVLDRVRGALPLGSPRSIAWLLVMLTASFVPLVALSGAWGGEASLLMLPAVGGTLVSWVAVPWLCTAGPQPGWLAGRATPVLLAWLGTGLNFALSMT